MEYAIEVKDLVKRYKDFVALSHFDLEVREGEIFGLLGPNGSGKTTTINCILSLLTYDQGDVRVFGKKMTSTSYDLKREIGVVMQNVAVFDEMTVYENIAFVLRVIDAPKSYIRKRVPYVISLVGLQAKSSSYPDELSGGEKQRVAIARALVNDPKLIIADEPTGNIDPELSYEIVELLKGINDCGTTILMVTHEHDLVRHFGGRIINITDGEIVFDEVIGGVNEA